MAEGDTTPVVILAFANDQDDYLKNIRRERQNVFAALRPQADRRAINVYKEEDTSTEALFKLFADYPDRVVILHYGGHANGTGLRLEAGDGSGEQAHAEGLAQLLGLQKNLKLVFLNGCATQGQVATLLAAGVKLVIATAVPIDDAMATEFAEQFYGALGNKASIGRAFETAKAFIATRYGADKTVGSFRGAFVAAQPQQTVDAGLTWGLYANDNSDDALAWALPDPPDNTIIIRGAPPSTRAGVVVNAGLIASTLTAIAPFSLKIRQELEVPKDSEDYDERVFPQLIMDAYPAPIGEQLGKLFAGNSADMARLRQLVLTYETLARLFCFAALSQLWNARVDKPDLAIADDQAAVLNSFMALTADNQPVFDYFRLITAIVDVFTANGTVPFMEECAGLTAELTDDPTTRARAFMDEMRAELAAGRVPAEEVESFCVQAETHLGTLLADFAFVVKYKFASIKNISARKARFKPAEYDMRQIWLDRVTAGLKDTTKSFASFVDNESVILQKDRKDLTDYLNLTPFIVDENALTGNDSSKLYFYDYHDADDNFHYVGVDNRDDRLVINSQLYPEIRGLCQAFRDTVFKT